MNLHGPASIGIHDGHNASACLFADGRLQYAIQEERLTGVKNQGGFPMHAVRACLWHGELHPRDMDQVAFASLRQTPSHLRTADQRAGFSREASILGLVRRVGLWSPYYRARPDLGWRERCARARDLGFQPRSLRRFEHHRCHAATAYFGLRADPETPYVVITADGYGDLHSGTIWVARRNELHRIGASDLGSSLGTVYGLVTGAMGFTPLEHEYKLMGMAPYAAAEHAAPLVARLHEILELDEDALRFRRRTLLPTIALSRHVLDLIRGQRFDNVCAALQQFTEEMLARLVTAAVRRTGIRRVLCAGGVFMNVKANQRLAALPEVEELAVFPSPGDETLPFGACYLAEAEAGRGDAIAPLGPYYLGDDISEAACREAFAGTDFEVRHHDDAEREVAALLAAGRIVARCKGRMEFGARALGNRSILADPANQDAVRVINRMIKQRDFWMPFAPLVRRARVHEYFDNPKDLPSPYMMLTFDTKDNFRELIAAVHNADLTARPQILEPAHNPDLDRLLRHFEAETGRGVLLNTSFNLHGHPIVAGPQEAIDVFRRSGLEYLALGDLIVAKRDRAPALTDVTRLRPATARPQPAPTERRAG